MLDARDPVCGMTVEVTTAYAEAVGGDTYYFCSESCRQRFDENPGGYGAISRQGSDPREIEHGSQFEFLPDRLDGGNGRG